MRDRDINRIPPRNRSRENLENSINRRLTREAEEADNLANQPNRPAEFQSNRTVSLPNGGTLEARLITNGAIGVGDVVFAEQSPGGVIVDAVPRPRVPQVLPRRPKDGDAVVLYSVENGDLREFWAINSSKDEKLTEIPLTRQAPSCPLSETGDPNFPPSIQNFYPVESCVFPNPITKTWSVSGNKSDIPDPFSSSTEILYRNYIAGAENFPYLLIKVSKSHVFWSRLGEGDLEAFVGNIGGENNLTLLGQMDVGTPQFPIIIYQYSQEGYSYSLPSVNGCALLTLTTSFETQVSVSARRMYTVSGGGLNGFLGAYGPPDQMNLLNTPIADARIDIGVQRVASGPNDPIDPQVIGIDSGTFTIEWAKGWNLATDSDFENDGVPLVYNTNVLSPPFDPDEACQLTQDVPNQYEAYLSGKRKNFFYTIKHGIETPYSDMVYGKSYTDQQVLQSPNLPITEQDDWRKAVAETYDSGGTDPSICIEDNLTQSDVNLYPDKSLYYRIPLTQTIDAATLEDFLSSQTGRLNVIVETASYADAPGPTCQLEPSPPEEINRKVSSPGRGNIEGIIWLK